MNADTSAYLGVVMLHHHHSVSFSSAYLASCSFLPVQAATQIGSAQTRFCASLHWREGLNVFTAYTFSQTYDTQEIF